MSELIKLEYPSPEICLMTMSDRQSRNMLSKALTEGIQAAFFEIKSNQELKVVITTGYDNFFCCGGSEAELTELTKGEKKASDLDFFKLPLECEIPTIALMQGHTLGGGLSFACLFDYLLFSMESYYSANFMKYGFTPGMGATYTVPKRFGQDLGREMLFTAREYTGKELSRRVPSLRVYPRQEILSRALELAQQLSSKTLLSLKLLKQSYADVMKKELAAALKIEAEMHAQTITSDEAKKRIQSEFKKMDE